MPDSHSEIGHLLAVGIVYMVIGQIRALEEKVPDPAERWAILRRSLEQFVREQGVRF